MRKIPISKHKLMGLGAVLFVSSLLLFQNCDQPLPSDEEHMQSFYQSLPFAYETKVDTIAYMSCVNGTSGASSVNQDLFTFYVGAHGSGTGVRLSPEYLEKTKYLREEELIESLQSSPLNSQAQPQLWVRGKREGLQGAFAYTPALEGADYENFLFDTLDSSQIAPQLVQSRGSFLNEFQGNAPSHQRRFEGRIRFLDDLEHIPPGADISGRPEMVKGFNEGNLLLSVNFLQGLSENHGAKTPEAINPVTRLYPGRSIYGVGFDLNFIAGSGPQGIFTAGTGQENRRVLSSVREVNLESPDRVLERTWNCPENLRFMIIRLDDVRPGFCTQATTGIPEQVVRVLNLSGWAVDTSNRDFAGEPKSRCIYPIGDTPSCYRSNVESVNYTGGRLGACSTEGTTNVCPHFLSICYAR